MHVYNKHAKRSHTSHKSTNTALRYYKAKSYKTVTKKQQLSKAWGHRLSSIFKAMLPSREND